MLRNVLQTSCDKRRRVYLAQRSREQNVSFWWGCHPRGKRWHKCTHSELFP